MVALAQGWWYGCGPHAFGWWGWLYPLLFLALLFLGVYLVAKALRGEASRTGDRALEVLRERYARGEIDKETFERMKRDLA
ncbi:hypothetical protein GCM10007092_15830 [Thermus composti]|uniref:SHOCT domain-containing protein n=1 Tax=Thermus composti TaxID=532059 RepID=A0ABV6Q0T0_9DEIN|nr:SHOCT domain-containing protein [Thermus composti]GGN02385.1 hypothetical protein GCM10007092_15830 [Thermus composti]